MIRRFLLAGAILGAIAGCREPVPADLVLFGTTWTGDSTRPLAAGVAIRGDSIIAVGDSATLAGLIGPATERIDQPAGLITPGFGDGHVHLLSGGFQLASVDLRSAATPAELARRIGAFAATLQPGQWITGGDWDHELWPGAPLPDRSWIDSVSPRNPVFVSRLDGHMALANSAALAAAGVDGRIGSISGGEIVRRRDGSLTGVFKDEAMAAVGRAIPPPSPSQLDSALARALEHAASLGVTALASMSSSWEDIAALRRARARGALTARISSYLPLGEWRAAAESLRINGPGDDWLRVAGVKGFVDGSLGSTTAWFDQPYTDAPATSGFLTTPEDSLRRWITAADSAGLQVVVHAIGDRANGLLLDLFGAAIRRNGARDRRFRIEHAQHLRPGDIARFAELGVLPSVQPYHAADDGRWAEKRIGPVRIRTTYPFRSLLDAGARLIFGSDWTVAPLDPLLGLEAAVTRQTIDGKQPEGFVPEEKIPVEDGLRAYTSANAFGMFLERRVGRLAPGMKADLVVFDRDLLTIEPTTIDQARVVATVVAGRVVFRRQ